MEVPQPVVDRLELVEVHHQQAEAAPRAGASGDLALQGGEEEAAVEERGQRVDRREADRRVTRPALLPRDHHRHVGEQDHRRQVDADGGGRDRVAERALRRAQQDRQQVPKRSGRRQADGDRGRDHEGRPTDDQRVGEEERALHAAGQGHEQRRHGDGDRPLDAELGRSQRVGGQQVVHDQHEGAGQREQDQDRGLVGGPEPGDGDDRRRGEQEDPADDPDDAVVGLCRHAPFGAVLVRPADHRRRGHRRLRADIGGRVRLRRCA